MTLIETFHAAHKARLSRLGSIPAKALLPEQFQREFRDLQAKIERQKEIISDLNGIIAKQRTIIRKFADDTDSPRPRIADVIAAVADCFDITRQVVVGTQRDAHVILARQTGYYVCRQLGFPYLAIGRAFFKDHSSAVHGVQKLTNRLRDDEVLTRKIDQVMTAIDLNVSRRLHATKEALA